jgi:hypothetical protein
MNTIAAPIPQSSHIESPAWLASAFRAVCLDIWQHIQKARTQAIADKAPWKDWCYAADRELAKYMPMPRGAITSKGVGLCAWSDVRQVYELPAALMLAVAATPLPPHTYLRQYLDAPELAVYIRTPGLGGLLQERGKSTYGILAFWLRDTTGRRELALLFNLGEDSSLLTIPDHGSLDESLAQMRFPGGTEIPEEKLKHIREALSLLLFYSCYKEIDEDPPAKQEGYDLRLLGKRVFSAQGVCSSGRWISVDGDYAWAAADTFQVSKRLASVK